MTGQKTNSFPDEVFGTMTTTSFTRLLGCSTTVGVAAGREPRDMFRKIAFDQVSHGRHRTVLIAQGERVNTLVDLIRPSQGAWRRRGV